MKTKRMRVSGTLGQGARGFTLQNDAGELWALDVVDIDAKLVGKPVIAEGTLAGLDRLHLDWIGEAIGQGSGN